MDQMAKNIADMTGLIVSLSAVKTISEFDNYIACWFIQSIVRITDDGLDMTQPQGYTTKLTDGEKDKFTTTLNDEFYHHRDLDI
jgi:hypothetical protein